MLVRAYRVSDKLGVVFIKGASSLTDTTLDGIGLLWRTLASGVLLILNILWVLLTPVRWIVVGLINLVLRLSGQTTLNAQRAATGSMARRAARSEMRANLAEDPLRTQNRVLSAMTVVLLIALIGAILWATNPARGGNNGDGVSVAGLNNALFAPTAETSGTSVSNPVNVGAAAAFATAVPTTTPLPSALAIRGSIAYTAREAGQTDIWVVPVGGRTPLRLTDSATDDRDPAWSPDGRQLAYASRQEGNWEIFIADIAAGTQVRMTQDLSFQANPAWSPDGDYLVYESYQGGDLNINFLRVDGTEAIQAMPGNSSTPDFAPAWSPDGRQIAFVSLREGNQDIFVFSLDDQSVTNITNTPTRDEDYPAWQPDVNSDLLAYSAVDEGAEKVFVKGVNDPAAPAQVLSFGRAPSWSPDGSSLVFTNDSVDSTQLTAFPFRSDVVGTPIISVLRGSWQPVWTASPLPTAFVNGGGAELGAEIPLYIEQETERPTDPPYPLQPLPEVNVESPALSDRVNDSFNAMRERLAETVDYDFLGRLDDAFWRLDRPPQPGEERRNWLMTGRSFAITRNSIVGFPPPLEVVREDRGVQTYWQLFLRADDDAQNGELGEPLRRIPWDFAASTEGDIDAYNAGGRVRDIIPAGYYIDMTQIAEDYGWQAVAAGSDWRANAISFNYWLFQKRDGLTWYDAMREIYGEGQLINFAPTLAPLTPLADTSGAGNASPVTVVPIPPTLVALQTTVPSGSEPQPTLPPDVQALLTPQPAEGQ